MEKAKVERLKRINYGIQLFTGLVMSMTGPIIYIHMVQNISEEFYRFIMFVNEIIGLVIFYYMGKEDRIQKMKTKFTLVVVGGCLSFVLANISGVYDPRLRFLILSGVEGIFSYLWMITMKDTFNNLIYGTELTLFDNSCKKYDRIGAIIGATTILFIPFELEFCLVFQSVGYCIMGITDYYIYKHSSDDRDNNLS